MLNDFNTEKKQLPELTLADVRFDFIDRQAISSSNDNPLGIDWQPLFIKFKFHGKCFWRFVVHFTEQNFNDMVSRRAH